MISSHVKITPLPWLHGNGVIGRNVTVCRVFRSESEIVWFFIGIYIINGMLHSRLTIRNFLSRAKKIFQGEISCLRTAI